MSGVCILPYLGKTLAMSRVKFGPDTQAPSMHRPQTVRPVDQHQVTSDFAFICDRLMAKPALESVPVWACPCILWIIVLGIGLYKGSPAFIKLFVMLCGLTRRLQSVP
eukprot:1583999-Heterocapsa_arctica.AAC.1